MQRSLKKLRDLTKQQPAPTDVPAPALNIEKLLRELQGAGNPSARDYRKRFLVKQGQKLLSVEVGDILYFYTDERFSFFRTRANQKFLVDYTLDG